VAGRRGHRADARPSARARAGDAGAGRPADPGGDLLLVDLQLAAGAAAGVDARRATPDLELGRVPAGAGGVRHRLGGAGRRHRIGRAGRRRRGGSLGLAAGARAGVSGHLPVARRVLRVGPRRGTCGAGDRRAVLEPDAAADRGDLGRRARHLARAVSPAGVPADRGGHPMLGLPTGGAMKRVIQAPNLALATLWADLLRQGGFDTSVQRAYVSSIAGEIPPDLALPEVWIADDDQVDA